MPHPPPSHALDETPTFSSSGTFTGRLALEYATFDVPPCAIATATRDVLLIVRISIGNDAFEARLYFVRTLRVTAAFTWPSGTMATSTAALHFRATQSDAEFTVELSPDSLWCLKPRKRSTVYS